jgi:hypothetical protein
MNRASIIVRAALAAALSIVSAASAQQATPREEALQQELADLKARIAKLESNGATQAGAQTKQDILADAQKRSTLGSSSPVTAGYDKGFFIKSDDGKFLLKPSAFFQFRYIANSSDDADGDNHIDSGFEFRRTRFRFDGNLYSPDLTYSVVFDTDRSGGTVSLLDAWAAYKFAPKWSVRVGQFKESVFHERDLPPLNQLAVDRTLVDAILGGNQTYRVQGVSLIYGGGKDDDVRAEVAVHDGANSRNTNFQDQPTGDFGFGARGEYRLKGDWADYKDFTAKGTKADLLVFGAGGDYTQAGDSDILRSTLDAQWENTTGLAVYGALHGNFSDGPADEAFDWGAIAQVGYLLNKKVEVFGRYDVIKLDETGSDNDTFNEFTIGANYFFGHDGAYLHRAKFTVDFIYLPDGAPSNQTGLGILASDQDEFVLRGQFQLQI